MYQMYHDSDSRGAVPFIRRLTDDDHDAVHTYMYGYILYFGGSSPSPEYRVVTRLQQVIDNLIVC